MAAMLAVAVIFWDRPSLARMPGCQAGQSCSAPAAGMALVFTRGSVVRTVVTSSKGTYRIRLAPGLYSVRVAQNRIARIAPLTVTVRSGVLLRRNFVVVDTGIR